MELVLEECSSCSHLSYDWSLDKVAIISVLFFHKIGETTTENNIEKIDILVLFWHSLLYYFSSYHGSYNHNFDT
jgi:hypothetical protein